MLFEAVLFGEGGRLALPPEGDAPRPPLPSWLPLSPRQQVVLSVALAHAGVRIGELRQRFPRAEKALRGDLARLQRLGMLRKAGTTKGVLYQLTEPWHMFFSPPGRRVLAQLFPGVSWLAEPVTPGTPEFG